MLPSDLGVCVVLWGSWGLQLLAPVKYDARDKHLICQVCPRGRVLDELVASWAQRQLVGTLSGWALSTAALRTAERILREIFFLWAQSNLAF